MILHSKKQLEEFFAQPDMQKQMETVTQSANMKKHLEKVVEETINSPLLQTKWQEFILKAGEAENQKVVVVAEAVEAEKKNRRKSKSGEGK